MNKLNMICLRLLVTIDKQLCKAQDAIISSTALFGNLSLVMFIGDFYQFALVSGHTLLDLS